MSRLSGLEAPPKVVSRRAGPHNYRVVGRRVLLTNDFGGWVWLSVDEYEAFLAGKIAAGHPRRLELARGGFLPEEFSLDAAAEDLRERGLLSWRGPARHVLILEASGAAMPLETARRAVDCVFAGPVGPLRLELAADDLDAAWPAAWFAVQYARRKSDWYGRPLDLVLRAGADLSGERADFLKGHGAALRSVVRADSGACGRKVPQAREGLLSAAGEAADGAGWADLCIASSWSSALVRPDENAGLDRFPRFYFDFLDRVLEHARSGAPLSEEWAAAALARRRTSFVDVLGELAYAPDGRVFSSETGLALAREGEALFELGALGAARYKEFGESPVAKACVAAAAAENQPLCAQCVYNPFCALAPSRNHRAQGTLWGRMPESADCSLQMALLDGLFERLSDDENRAVLEGWAA